ncbi:hypothetical protein Nmel_000861 [Mimus melanotis]
MLSAISEAMNRVGRLCSQNLVISLCLSLPLCFSGNPSLAAVFPF